MEGEAVVNNVVEIPPQAPAPKRDGGTDKYRELSAAEIQADRARCAKIITHWSRLSMTQGVSHNWVRVWTTTLGIRSNMRWIDGGRGPIQMTKREVEAREIVDREKLRLAKEAYVRGREPDHPCSTT